MQKSGRSRILQDGNSHSLPLSEFSSSSDFIPSRRNLLKRVMARALDRALLPFLGSLIRWPCFQPQGISLVSHILPTRFLSIFTLAPVHIYMSVCHLAKVLLPFFGCCISFLLSILLGSLQVVISCWIFIQLAVPGSILFIWLGFQSFSRDSCL